jgi:lipid-A-disaccharide synthase
MSADVFIVAGEASGDLQASLLVRAMRARDPKLSFAGVGGDRMREAGVEVQLDSVRAEWASMGPLSAYVKIPWLLAVMLGLAQRLRARPPRLLVCVDFGAFNLRLLEWLRFTGYRKPAIYYFPPGAWLDNRVQAQKVSKVATALTPFVRQRDFYRACGLPVEYFGHPLVSAIEPREPLVRGPVTRIAVLPGSRHDEVAIMLPALARAAKVTEEDLKSEFLVVAASEPRAAQIRRLWAENDGPAEARIVRRDATSVFAEADIAWTASGTAVLEGALRCVPQVAFYRLPPAVYAIVQRRHPHIVRGPVTLPNLIAGRSVVPELLQDELTPANLCSTTRELLENDARAAEQARGYAEVRRLLGAPDSLQRIADFAASMLGPERAQ